MSASLQRRAFEAISRTTDDGAYEIRFLRERAK